MLRLFFVVVILLPALELKAQTVYGSVYVTSVGTIIDGDSFKVNINEWPGIVGKSITVRINDVDTPEMRGKCPSEKMAAREAKQYTASSLRAAQSVELRNIKRGKYFRLIADVYVDNESLGESLIRANLARRYSGGKRASWCSEI